MRKGATTLLEHPLLKTLRVSELELAAIERDRAAIDQLRAELATRTAALREHEENVILRIEAGAHVDGEVTVLANERQNVSWFSVCRRELGEEFIRAEKASWPLTFYKSLQIG